MTSEELKLLINEGEGLTVEFKEKYTSRIAEDMVGFANSKGGYIILGVVDNGRIVGEELTGHRKAEILNLAKNCHDSVKISLQQISNVIVVEVFEGENKPYQCSSGYFKRYDAVTQKMLPEEIKIMYRDNLGVSFENIFCRNFDTKGISLEKVRAFLREAKYTINVTKNNLSEFLKSLNLADKGKIKNAGVMLFGKDISPHILHCQMTLVAYKDLEGTDIYDRQDIKDDLLTQFNNAVFFIQKHLNKGSVIRGFNRYDSYEIPLEALREAVTNALIHRDYSIFGTQITIAVFPDRVEISNPGSLPKGMEKDDLGKLSVRRNEIIADLFSRMDKGEKLGIGIKKIRELIKNSGLRVKFESNMFFTATFYRAKKPTYIQNEGTAQKSTQKSTQKILEIITNNKFVTRIEIAQQIGLSESGVKKQLKKLQKEGILKRIGPDKGGHWEVIKK